MDLRQLHALVAIADHGSFSAAAAALHTVQSNVSSHIARLERELGAELVDRHSGSLTEEGHVVVERARRVGAELEALVADVAYLRSEVVGTVRMGMIGTTARWLTPLLLDKLASLHPKVRLVVVEGTTATLEPTVAGGALEAAIVNLPSANPGLAARPLFEEDLVLVVPSGHRLAGRTDISLSELDGMELLMPAPGTQYRQELDEAARQAGITLVPRVELDGVRLIAYLATLGYGPAILPATAGVRGWSGFASLPVQGLPRRLVGVVLRRARPSAPTRAVLDLLDPMTEQLEAGKGLHPVRGEAPSDATHRGHRTGGDGS